MVMVALRLSSRGQLLGLSHRSGIYKSVQSPTGLVHLLLAQKGGHEVVTLSLGRGGNLVREIERPGPSPLSRSHYILHSRADSRYYTVV